MTSNVGVGWIYQGIARRGHYGAFLLTEKDLLYQIVSKLSGNLSIPVTCKIRLLSTLEDTLELCHTLCRAGCSMLVVHGRTKEEKQQATGPCNWEAIRIIKEALPIPVIANGGISNLDDVERCLRETGVDGVMSSEAVLENPGLFSRNISLVTGQTSTQEDLCLEYLDIAEQHPPPNLKFVRAHVFKMLYTDLQVISLNQLGLSGHGSPYLTVHAFPHVRYTPTFETVLVPVIASRR